MAYEGTEVPVSRTQDKIKSLILKNKGTGIAFVCEPRVAATARLIFVGWKR